MTRQIIYDGNHERFNDLVVPSWYEDAVLTLHGGVDRAYGLYLYNLLLQMPGIDTVLNIGTARGFSAVCAAKAISQSGRDGMVHTIDVIPPNKPRRWHVPKQTDSDPAKGEELTVHDFLRSYEPDSGELPIRHHVGDSVDVLSGWTEGPIDLVFHDGRHTYEHVRTEIELSRNLNGGSAPIHVFDDCFLYRNEKEFWIFTEVGILEHINSIPFLRRMPEYAIIRKRAAGVARAVREALETYDWSRLEIVEGREAPITTLFP